MNATKPFQTQNFYELLEVTPSADPDAIKAAYDRSVELYGPDSVAMYAMDDASQVTELRARIDEAWKVLGDHALRGAYDASLGVKDGWRPKTPMSLVTDPAANESEATKNLSESPAAAHLEPPSRESKFVEFNPPGESAPSPGLKDAGEKSIVRQPESPAAKREEDPKADAKAARSKVEIPPEADFNGELLRRVRESRGKSLVQIAEKTRIGVRHLENVEADRYNELPVGVYLRGILMNISRELGLDPLRVSKSYLEVAARGKK